MRFASGIGTLLLRHGLLLGLSTGIFHSTCGRGGVVGGAQLAPQPEIGGGSEGMRQRD